jgi:RimJ/RimL family protein N-acetyltransferase
MNIKGRHVILRAIERADLPLILEWSNDPEIQLQMGGWHLPTSMAVQERWFESLKLNETHQRFAVSLDAGEIIGTANLVEINWKDRNAFHGMMLGSTAQRGKGYATDTVMAIMRHAFEELGLERLDGSIIEYNTASQKLYIDRCAWKVEGRKKNWYWRRNRFWDKIIVGINREDYAALVERTRYWE